MKTLIILVASFAAPAFAGGVTVGNGGNIVVCRDAGGKVTKAELFDLFEGRALKGLNYEESPTPYPQQAQAIIDNLGKTLGQSADAEGGVISELAHIQKHLIFLPPGTGLKPIPDGAEFILPKGCDLVQTVNFRNYQQVYVDSDIWNILSETQKAALLVHETIYLFLRETGPKASFVEVNSVRARRAVALLFAGVPMVNPQAFDGSNGMRPLRCYTDEALEADRPASMFYLFPNKAGKLTAQFLEFLDRRVITRALVESYNSYDFSAWPLSVENTIWYADGKLDSLVDSDSYVSIHWSPRAPSKNRILVRDIDGNSSWESFSCK